ncbi:MAG: LD-carboxypeptidase [Myxococcota bacterium]
MKPPWLTPEALRKGDRVRIVAPGFAFDRRVFAAGLAQLEARGLRPFFDEGLFMRYRYLAGDDERRLAEMQAAIDDEQTKAIWLARAGYGSTRLALRLQTDALRHAPKWLIGFSDGTALHGLWARCGVSSIHGPNITTLYTWGEAALGDLWGWLQEGKGHTISGRRFCGKGSVEGVLVGGNISVLAAMVGTGQLPSMEGCIVVLEDIGERPYRLDRALTQLIQAKAFVGVQAFVVGQLTGCEPPPRFAGEFSAVDVVGDILSQFRVPVLVDAPIGHEPSSFGVCFGTPAVLNVEEESLTIRSRETLSRS